MKKFFISSICLAVLFFTLISVTCALSYNYISERVIENNVGKTLRATVNATSFNIEQKNSTYYEEIGNFVKTAPSTDSAESKIEFLEENMSTCQYLKNLNAGFGKFVRESNSKFYYEIEGKVYKDKNSNFTSHEVDAKIKMHNFGRDFTTTGDSIFTNQDYIVFIYSNIMVYLNANKYLDSIFTSSDILNTNNYFIMAKDGNIFFQNNTTNTTAFFQLIRNSNIEHIASDIISDFNSGSALNKIYPNIYIGKESCYLITTPLAGFDFNENLYLVEMFGMTQVKNSFSTALLPLTATYIIIGIFVIFAFSLFFYNMVKKNNDINGIINQKKNASLYLIRLNKKGEITSMNADFVKLLKSKTLFNTIRDFDILDEEDNFKLLNAQRPLTIVINDYQTSNNQRIILRGIILKKTSSYLLACADASEKEEVTLKYRNLALYDSITSLPNKVMFKEEITNEVNRITTNNHQVKSSIIVIQIRNFKNLLNLYGSETGDKIIMKVIETLKGLITDKMSLFYIKTGTLGVVYKNINEYQDAVTWLQFVLEFFNKPLEIDNNRLLMDLIFAVYNLDLKTFDNTKTDYIYKSLKQTLNKVSTVSSAKYEVYNLSIGRFISNNDLLENDMKHALESDEFVMYLQPQYDNKTGGIGGFEMLVRWNNPKYFNQSPATFIEIAEKNGMIIQIGKIINEKSMQIAKRLEETNVNISLNVSPVQLMQAGFVQEFIDVAKKYEVNPKHIAVEITETFLVENFGTMIEKLKLLKKEGFKIHLDDFGTGYSSMLYLKELPIDAIKIDKEFIKHVETDEYSKAIVVRIIDLARDLKLEIIAEGVENDAQQIFLVKHKCDYSQGYLISRAVDYDTAVQLIKDYNIDKIKHHYSAKNKK